MNPRGPSVRERDDWTDLERFRVQVALGEAREWAYLDPVGVGFWAAFDGTILANYPSVRFEEKPQTSLGAFADGGEAHGV